MRLACFALLSTVAGCNAGTCRGGQDTAPGSVVSSAPPAVVTPADTSRGAEVAILARLDALRRGGRTLLLEPPTEAEEQAFEAWVTAAAAAAQRGGPLPGAAPAGFAITDDPEHGLWILAEDGARRRGTGAVLLHVGPSAPLIVEAPHTFFDRGTLSIAATIFVARRARALLVNTAHRYGGRPKPSDDDAAGEGGAPAGHRPPPSSDLAHAERSYFLAAHRALGAPPVLALQLHGFQDASAPGVSAIVSAAGTGADLSALLPALRAALPDDAVRAYPAEIRKLGGALNMQARWSARAGAPFFHIEMSRALRDRLVADAALRRRVATALPPR